MLALQLSKDHLQIIVLVHRHEFLVVETGIFPAGLPELPLRGIPDRKISPKLDWIQPTNVDSIFRLCM